MAVTSATTGGRVRSIGSSAGSSKESSGRKLALGLLLAAVAAALAFATPASASALQTYQYVHQFGSNGAGDGQFSQPYFMAFGVASLHLYVADKGNQRIVELAPDGTYVGKLADPIWSPSTSGFDQPQAVACAGGTVFGLDYTDGLASFDAATRAFGTAVTTFGGGDAFNLPSGVAADAAGGVFVADTNDQRIVKFTYAASPASLTNVTTFGDTGSSKLQSPSGIAVGPQGQVYVADSLRGQVVRFTPDSTKTVYTATAFWGGSGTVTGELSSPTGLACDAAGNVYITEPDAQLVKKLSGANGALLASWGGSGTGNGKFTYPLGIAVNSDGHVFVCDRDAARIQEFQPVDMGPLTFALTDVTAKKGKSAFFTFKVDEDVSPKATAWIKIMKGKVVSKTIPCGFVTSGVWTTLRWQKCTLAKGAYTWAVYATDQGGHTQQAPPGSRKLTVK